MKNIVPGLFFILAFLPQVSFGAIDADPALAYCNKQIDAESVTFFQQEGADRVQFMAAHQDLVAKQDHLVKAWRRKKDEERRQVSLTGNAPSVPSAGPLPQITDSAWTSFYAKQQGESQAFLQKIAAEKQKCLNSQSSTPPSS